MPAQSIPFASACRTRPSASGPDCVFSIARRVCQELESVAMNPSLFWNDCQSWGVSRSTTETSPACSCCAAVVACGVTWNTTFV
jgi:hypothetical protein